MAGETANESLHMQQIKAAQRRGLLSRECLIKGKCGDSPPRELKHLKMLPRVSHVVKVPPPGFESHITTAHVEAVVAVAVKAAKMRSAQKEEFGMQLHKQYGIPRSPTQLQRDRDKTESSLTFHPCLKQSITPSTSSIADISSPSYESHSCNSPNFHSAAHYSLPPPCRRAPGPPPRPSCLFRPLPYHPSPQVSQGVSSSLPPSSHLMQYLPSTLFTPPPSPHPRRVRTSTHQPLSGPTDFDVEGMDWSAVRDEGGDGRRGEGRSVVMLSREEVNIMVYELVVIGCEKQRERWERGEDVVEFEEKEREEKDRHRTRRVADIDGLDKLEKRRIMKKQKREKKKRRKAAIRNHELLRLTVSADTPVSADELAMISLTNVVSTDAQVSYEIDITPSTELAACIDSTLISSATSVLLEDVAGDDQQIIDYDEEATYHQLMCSPDNRLYATNIIPSGNSSPLASTPSYPKLTYPSMRSALQQLPIGPCNSPIRPSVSFPNGRNLCLSSPVVSKARLREFRANSLGILVSAIKTDWANLYPADLSLEICMGFFGIKRLKQLLVGVPNIIIAGQGGLMRTATVEHAKLFGVTERMDMKFSCSEGGVEDSVSIGLGDVVRPGERLELLEVQSVHFGHSRCCDDKQGGEVHEDKAAEGVATINGKDEQTVNKKDEQTVNGKDEQTVSKRDEQTVSKRDEQTVNGKDEQTVSKRDEQTVNGKDEQTVSKRDEQTVNKENTGTDELGGDEVNERDCLLRDAMAFRKYLTMLLHALVCAVCQQQHARQLLAQVQSDDSVKQEDEGDEPFPMEVGEALKAAMIDRKYMEDARKTAAIHNQKGIKGLRLCDIKSEWLRMMKTPLEPLLGKAAYTSVSELIADAEDVRVIGHEYEDMRCFALVKDGNLFM